MSSPRPGRPARGSRTGRPVMVLLDLLGRRWALRVIWELRDGPRSFRELQARCGGLSPSVLNRRLGELRAAGIVAAGDDGYRLTARGSSLIDFFEPLSRWARDWAEELR